MSRTERERRETTCWFVWTEPCTGDATAATAAAADQVFASLGVVPKQASVSRGVASVVRRAVTRSGVARLASDPATRSVCAYTGDFGVEVNLALRPATNGFPSAHWCFSLSGSAPQPCPWSVAERFLRVIAEQHTVIHGAGIRVPTLAHARTEADLVGTDETHDIAARKHFDAMNVDEALTRLRRLYPTTIIGPEIWAALPPLPQLDPMPTVTDLGNCKLLTAWPELCDPRDKAFLRGTVALRQWLWPHTIQNPADHVDADPFEYTSF